MARAYRVQFNDTPQTIARVTTGSPARWPEIIALNPHKPRVVVQGLTTFAALRAGEMLNVPERIHTGCFDVVGVGRVGVGDGTSDLTSTPQYQQGLTALQNQLTQENTAQGGSLTTLQGKIGAASYLYQNEYEGLITNTFNTGALASANGDPLVGAAQAASQVVATGSTILGAVHTISGLVDAAEHGTPTQIVQAFSGAMLAAEGIAVATGAVTAGVGAAICAGIALATDVIDDLISSPPVVDTIGTCSITDPAAVPPWVIGVVYPVMNPHIQPVTGGPSSSMWRKFPVAANVPDAWWFTFVGIIDATTGQQTAGTVPWITPGGWQSGGSYDQWASCGGNGIRPIDAAYAQYHQLECDIIAANQTLALPAPGPGEAATAYANFTQAYYAAWAANQEFALNGLGKSVQSDPTVLIHVANHWNNAHAPGVGLEIDAPPNSSSSQAIAWNTTCSSTLPANAYIHLLVGDLRSQSGSDSDSILTGGQTLHLNTGPLYEVLDLSAVALLGATMIDPGAAATTSSGPPTSTASNVAVGTAAVVGTAALSTFIYAQIAGVAFTTVLSHVWKHTKSLVSGSKKTVKRRRARENPIMLPEDSSSSSTAMQLRRRVYMPPKRRVAFRVNLDQGPAYEAIVLTGYDTAVYYRYGKPVVQFKPAKYQFGKIRQQYGELLIYADQVTRSLIG